MRQAKLAILFAILLGMICAHKGKPEPTKPAETTPAVESIDEPEVEKQKNVFLVKTKLSKAQIENLLHKTDPTTGLKETSHNEGEEEVVPVTPTGVTTLKKKKLTKEEKRLKKLKKKEMKKLKKQKKQEQKEKEQIAEPIPIEPVKPTPMEPGIPITVEPTPMEPTTPMPVEPMPVEPMPVEPTPVEPTPVEPMPVEPMPVEPTPVEPTPVEPTPIEPAESTKDEKKTKYSNKENKKLTNPEQINPALQDNQKELENKTAMIQSETLVGAPQQLKATTTHTQKEESTGMSYLFAFFVFCIFVSLYLIASQYEKIQLKFKEHFLTEGLTDYLLLDEKRNKEESDYPTIRDI